MSVLVVAEIGSNWRFGDDHLANAYRSIKAAKECGSDCWKGQWTSDGHAMAKRRGLDSAAGEMYSRYVSFPDSWLPLLADECHRVGLQFGCTVFLPQDVGAVHRHVDFVKVSAFEAMDKTLREEWKAHRVARRMFVSVSQATDFKDCYGDEDVERLHCISDYPTKIENLHLSMMKSEDAWDRQGVSDHSGHVLTGAVAVGAGARIIESHVRLHDTPRECPDWGHSLVMPDEATRRAYYGDGFGNSYYEYVQNIRTAERMM